MKPKVKAQPLQIDQKAVITALKSENRKLQTKLVKVTVQNFSLKSEVAALKKELKNAKKHSPSYIELLKQVSKMDNEQS